MGSAESGSGASTSGGIRVQHFYSIGPAVEESAAGWGLGLWGGTVAGEITDNAIIPLKERVVDRYYDPFIKLYNKIFKK